MLLLFVVSVFIEIVCTFLCHFFLLSLQCSLPLIDLLLNGVNLLHHDCHTVLLSMAAAVTTQHLHLLVEVVLIFALLSVTILYFIFILSLDSETVQVLKLWHDPHYEVNMVLII